MTNSFGIANQPQQNYVNYSMIQQPNQGGGLGVFGAATLGFIGGGTCGYLKHRRPVKNGEVTDTFVKKAFDRYIDKGVEQHQKNFFIQAKNVLNRLDGVDTPERLKTLLNDNNAVKEKVSTAFNVDEACSILQSSNLSTYKDRLKEVILSNFNKEKETVRNAISSCWDGEKKKLVKVDEVSEKLFNAIKSTASRLKWNKALKYGGIGAAIVGGLVLTYKSTVAILTRVAQKRQMQAMQNAYMQQQMQQNAQQQPNMQQQFSQQTMVA